MKKPLLLSRLLQLAIVLSFFLPFFFVGCEGTGESADPSDSTLADTIAVSADALENKIDTLLTIDSTSLTKSQASVEDSIKSSS